jgi:hypothetical protein
MTLDSQLRLCRAGMIIGVLLCVAAVLEVSVGLLGLFSDFDAADREALKDPQTAGRFAGEVLITIVVRLWPLLPGLIFLVPSLIWHRRLRRVERALS